LVLLAGRFADIGHSVAAVDRTKQRRIDEAGADRVRADTEPAVVVGDVLREQHDAALRCVVGAAAFAAFEAFDAGDGDDRTTALCDHVRKYRFGGQERASEVDVLHALPLGDGNQVDRPATRDAGRGNEDVDSAVTSDGIVHDLLL